MLQKLPLTLFSHTFISLNTSHTIFKRVSLDIPNTPPPTNFISAYMQRPASLEHLPLLEASHSWSFSTHRKKCQWKLHKPAKIVCDLPCFLDIPPSISPLYVNFCWSELLLYKPFRNVPKDIGSSDLEIVSAWESFHGSYNPWHVDREPSPPPTISVDTPPPDEDHPTSSINLSEWELLSQLHPGNNLQLDDLDMLGHRNFDTNHNWGHTQIPLHFAKLSHLIS